MRILRGPICACRSRMLSMWRCLLRLGVGVGGAVTGQPIGAFEADRQQVLGFHGELHRQFLEHDLAETVHDHVDGVFLGDAAAAAIEELVVADPGRGRLVLDDGGRVLDLHVRNSVRAAPVAHQQRVALRVVARALGGGQHLHQAAVRVLPVARGDALRDDGAAGVAADVDHLGAGVGLLVVVRERDGIELAHRVVAAQHAARVFPGDRRARLDLRPADPRTGAAALAALGDEVVDAAAALLVAGIPVLHGRVLDAGVRKRHQLHDRRVQLVLVAHRRGAALEVAHVAALVGDDERAFELPRVGRVDAEIRRELHRAAHALRHVHERAVGEHRRVERREDNCPYTARRSRDTARRARGGWSPRPRRSRRSRPPSTACP